MMRDGRKIFALTPCLLASTVMVSVVHAEDVDNSQIVAVKVYPGVAMVERAASVSAITHQLRFSCLPASLDVQSLAIKAEHGTQLGEMQILTKPRAQADDPCDRSDIAQNIRSLEQKREELSARVTALQNVQNYVKTISGNPKIEGAGGSNVLATATAIRTITENTALSSLQIDRQIKAIDNQLEPLLRERDRVEGRQASTLSVTVEVSAGAPDTVHLTYQVAGPGWSPSYRATLDTKTGRLVVERQALVAQATGEDWSKVRLTLATGQPGKNTSPSDTNSWRISLAPPEPKPADTAFDRSANYVAPPPPMMIVAPAPDTANRDAPRAPLYDVQSFTGNFDTEYAISTPVSVPSNGLRVAMKLGEEAQNAQLYVETTPANDTRAWLMAEISRPAGVLPPGKMSLYRDGAFIGENWYAPDAAEKQSVAFGTDELTQVTILANRDNAESDDRTGTPGQRLISRSYQITNRHMNPISFHVLEATPVTSEVKISIDKKFEPAVSETDWQHRDGVVTWKFDLDAGKSQILTAKYAIHFPKSEKLQD